LIRSLGFIGWLDLRVISLSTDGLILSFLSQADNTTDANRSDSDEKYNPKHPSDNHGNSE
jgi:hypothetical protein